MALSITLGTLISILAAGGRVIYTTYDITTSGIDTVKSKPSNKSLLRCTSIADAIKSIEPKILQSSQAHVVVQNLVSSSEWAKKYDKKCLIKKVFMNNSYKKKFKDNDRDLSRSYMDFVLSLLLVKIFPDLYASPDTGSTSDLLHEHQINISSEFSENDDIKSTNSDGDSDNNNPLSLLDIIYPDIRSHSNTNTNNINQSIPSLK